MKKSVITRRYWKNVTNGNCILAPTTRDLSKHGLWIEISKEEYLMNKKEVSND